MDAVDSALGGNKLDGHLHMRPIPLVPDTDKVKDLTSIELSLIHGGSQSGKIDFTSLGLPSLGFLKDAQKIDVNLSWSVNVRLITDGSGLVLAPAAGDVLELTRRDPHAPTSSFEVDLGALVVKATTIPSHGSRAACWSTSTTRVVGFGSAPTRASKPPGTSRPKTARSWACPAISPSTGRSSSRVNPAGHMIKVEHMKIETDGSPERDPGRGRAIREVTTDPHGHVADDGADPDCSTSRRRSRATT